MIAGIIYERPTVAGGSFFVRVACPVSWIFRGRGSGKVCPMSMLPLTSQHYDLRSFPTIQTWSFRYLEVEEEPPLSVTGQKNLGSVGNLNENPSTDISPAAPGANNGGQTLGSDENCSIEQLKT